MEEIRGKKKGRRKRKGIKRANRLTQLSAGNISILNIPPITTDSAPRVIDDNFNTAIVEW